MKFSADCPSRLIFDNWTPARFQAMADENGIYTTALRFYHTTYNAADNVVSARQMAGGYTTTDNGDGLTIKAENTRNKLVLGDGAKVGAVTVVNGKVVSSVPSNAYVLETQNGATVGAVNGCLDDVVYGEIINNISGGTISSFYGAGQKPTLYGNVTNNYTGGTISTYRGGSHSGTIHGNVTNNFGTKDQSKTPEIAGFVGGNHETGAIKGTITNNYYSVKMRGVMYGGNRKGEVGKIVNNFYDGFNLTRGDTNAQYCGSNSTGKVLNYIENNFYGGTFTNTNAASQDFYCGNATNASFGDPAETIAYRIKNTFKGGTFTGYRLICGSNSENLASDPYGIWNVFEDDTDGSYVVPKVAFYATKSQSISKVKNTFNGTLKNAIYCGSNSGDVGSITNEFLSGCNQTSYIYAGNNSSGTVDSIVNKLEGGKINHFYGAGRAGSVGSVTNVVGAVETEGPEITNFYGGSYIESSSVETIANTIRSGSFTNSAYGGSLAGIVGKITNEIIGGVFNSNYYVCGNNTATFTEVTDKSTVRIENNVSGGTFLRLVGGSYNADVDGTIQSVYNTAIVATTAIYAGNASSGDIAGTIYNTINGTVTDQKATIRVFYGGNNNAGGTIGSIVNIVNGGQLRAFYGGCNYAGKPMSISNTVLGGVFGCEYFRELEDESIYFCGGSRVADLVSDVNTTIKGGTLINIFAGTLLGNDSGEVKLTVAPEGELTVLGKAYGITGAVSNEANPICIGKDSYLSFAACSDSDRIYVCQVQAWDEDSYVSVPNTQITIGWSNGDGVTGTPANVVRGDNTYLMFGDPATVDAVSLVLTDRIAIKAYFAKSSVSDGFTYSFSSLDGVVLASGTKAELTPDGEYYYVVLPAIGLADFEKPFLLSGDSLQTFDMSVTGLADFGADYYDGKDAKAKRFFQSIGDLGRSANGNETVYGLTAEAVSYTASGTTVKGGTDELDVQSMALMMSNAVGISLRGVAASDDLGFDVFVNGQKVTELCGISFSEGQNGTYDVSVDLYFSASAMSEEFKVELKNADGSVTYLETYNRLDNVAQKIGTSLAEDLLVYIQAVAACKA